MTLATRRFAPLIPEWLALQQTSMPEKPSSHQAPDASRPVVWFSHKDADERCAGCGDGLGIAP